MKDNKLYFWLSRSGMTDRRLNALLEVYSPSEIWDELPSSDKLREFMGDKSYETLMRFRSENFLDRELSLLIEKGVRIVTRADEKFPKRLLEREVSPPPLLYYKGDLSLADTLCVAVVGTRACSHYGKEVAELVSRGLAEAGVTVVSGLATGVDAYAHAACLRSGGKTIAVLGGGFDYMTPVSNLKLAEEVEYSGLIVTEYHPSLSPTKYTFPERNRIISGLSVATVVVEAGEKSGALITAEYALEQGRDVYAVPGNITSSRSRGANALIRDGAKPLCAVEDILVDLRLKIPKKEKSPVVPLDFYEEKIYTLLSDGDKTVEELIELSGLKASEVGATVTGMEIKGLLIRRANAYGVKQKGEL